MGLALEMEAKNQTHLVQTLTIHAPELRPSGNFTTDCLLKTRVALYRTTLTTNVQDAIQQLRKHVPFKQHAPG